MIKFQRKNLASITGFLGLSLLAIACSDSGGTNITNNIISLFDTVPTRADDVATKITDSWSDNEKSINLGSNEDIEEARTFQSFDGSGIFGFVQGDDGDEHAYLASYDSSGGMRQATRIRGPFSTSPFGDAVDDMIVVFTPSGDAVIAFVAVEDDDDSVTNDVESDRVFYGTFTRSLANTPLASTGQRFGFSSFTPIDTNVVNVDDNDALGMFVSTNLVDGNRRPPLRSYCLQHCFHCSWRNA